MANPTPATTWETVGWLQNAARRTVVLLLRHVSGCVTATGRGDQAAANHLTMVGGVCSRPLRVHSAMSST
jgi:hypothetical protein